MSRLDRYYIPPGVPARPPVPPPNNPGSSSAGSAAPPLPKKKGILVPPPLPPSAPSSVLSGNTSSTVGIPVWAFQVRKTFFCKFDRSQRSFRLLLSYFLITGNFDERNRSKVSSDVYFLRETFLPFAKLIFREFLKRNQQHLS